MKRKTPLPLYISAAIFSFVFVGCTHQQPSPSNTNTTNQNNTNLNQQVNVNTNTAANTNTNSDQEVDTSDWLTYTNEEYGFSFKYPEDWKITEHDKVLTIVSPETLATHETGNTNPYFELFVYLYPTFDDAPYFENDNFTASLQEAENNDFISDLQFLSDSRALFLEKNEYLNEYQYTQYYLLDNKSIIGFTYFQKDQKKVVIEKIVESFK